MTFSPFQFARYTGRVLRPLVGQRLLVTNPHVQSGIGDPATDDCCMVMIQGGTREYRVASCHLRHETEAEAAK